MASVADLITIVRGIYSACADVGQAKKTVQIAGEKLVTVLPVLEMLYDRQHVYDDPHNNASTCSFEDTLSGLKKDLMKVQAAVNKALSMNGLLYMIKASSIHEELEASLRHLHLTMGALSVRQSHSLQTQICQFQQAWEERERELQSQRALEQRERCNLLQGNVAANVIDATQSTGSELIQDLQNAHKAMEEEYAQLQRDVLQTHDSVVRGKAAQEEAYMLQIIAAIEQAEAEQNRELEQHQQDEEEEEVELPNWAICPITGDVMEDPVCVDCRCVHIFERQAIKEWISRGHASCPMDQLPLRSTELAPNTLIRDAIQHVVGTGLYKQKRQPQDQQQAQQPQAEQNPNGPSSIPSSMKREQVLEHHHDRKLSSGDNVRQAMPIKLSGDIVFDDDDDSNEAGLVTVQATPVPTRTSTAAYHPDGSANSATVNDSTFTTVPATITQQKSIRIAEALNNLELQATAMPFPPPEPEPPIPSADPAKQVKLCSVHKSSKSASIGIVMKDVDGYIKIKSIQQGSLCSKAGLEPGMVVLAINGTEFEDSVAAGSFLRKSVGHLEIRVSDPPEITMVEIDKPTKDTSIGIAFNGEDGNLVVTKIEEGGLCQKAGLRTGMVLISINGFEFKSTLTAGQYLRRFVGKLHILTREPATRKISSKESTAAGGPNGKENKPDVESSGTLCIAEVFKPTRDSSVGVFLGNKDGMVKVSRLNKGGLCLKAGIVADRTLVSINGLEFNDSVAAGRYLKSVRGRMQIITRDENNRQEPGNCEMHTLRKPSQNTALGIVLKDNDDGRIEIAKIHAGKLFSKSKLAPGMILLSVNTFAFDSSNAATTYMKDAKGVMDIVVQSIMPDLNIKGTVKTITRATTAVSRAKPNSLALMDAPVLANSIETAEKRAIKQPEIPTVVPLALDALEAEC